VIRTSSSKAIDQLIADLSADRKATRDAAIARLSVIGTRAVDRLIRVLGPDQPAVARVSALRALEAIADPRAIAVALDALGDDDSSVAAAAAATAGVFLRGARGALVVDRLTTAALDVKRPEEVRVSAIRALSELEASTLKPLWKALSQDASPLVRRLSRSDAGEAGDEEHLSADPDAARESIMRSGANLPLPSLHRLLERARERESAERLSRRESWTRVRAAIHLALARRGSRLGVYDLRESLERATEPLPVEFLTALALVGDATCLDPIAAAFAKGRPAKTPAGHVDWWQRHLGDVFRAILEREHLTPRHAIVKKIATRWGLPSRTGKA
jgi:HEAT repeat protein